MSSNFCASEIYISHTNRVWSILLIKHDLHGELHDGIDDIIGIVLEGLDGLGLGHIGL